MSEKIHRLSNILLYLFCSDTLLSPKWCFLITKQTLYGKAHLTISVIKPLNLLCALSVIHFLNFIYYIIGKSGLHVYHVHSRCLKRWL